MGYLSRIMVYRDQAVRPASNCTLRKVSTLLRVEVFIWLFRHGSLGWGKSDRNPAPIA